MSLGDISIVDTGGLSSVPTQKFKVQAGATVIFAGEPVKLASAGGLYVVKSATNEPVTGTPTFLGIAQSTSNNTATADGYVDVYMPIQGVVFRAAAKVKSNIDTDAKIDSVIRNKRKAFDLTSGVFTLSESVADAGTNGLYLLDANPVNGTVDFEVRSSCLAKN